MNTKSPDMRGISAPHEMTTSGSHIATRRGYAAGRIIDPGELVPADIAVAEEWMEPTGSEHSLRDDLSTDER